MTTTDVLAKRAADNVEYRVRTAIALYKGGHDYQAEIVKGRAAAEQIVREATGEHYEIEMPCGDAAPHDRHVWQMSSTGYCLCEGKQATATEAPPVQATVARNALADMPTHVDGNGVRYGRLGEPTADYIIETMGALIGAAPDDRMALYADGINLAAERGLGPHPLPESYVRAVHSGVDAALALLGRHRGADETKNRSDLDRAQRVGAVEQADEYLSTHRKTEVWSLINRLRDELVRA